MTEEKGRDFGLGDESVNLAAAAYLRGKQAAYSEVAAYLEGEDMLELRGQVARSFGSNGEYFRFVAARSSEAAKSLEDQVVQMRAKKNLVKL